jgi:hypothetical protein
VKLPGFTAGSQASATLCGAMAVTRRFFGPSGGPRLPGAVEGAAISIATSAAAATTARRTKGRRLIPVLRS